MTVLTAIMVLFTPIAVTVEKPKLHGLFNQIQHFQLFLATRYLHLN